MDSSFEDRVHQSFGSLGSSFPSWCLSNQQCHRNSWISGRHRSPSRDDTPCSSSFEGFSPSLQRPCTAADRFREDVGSDSDGRDSMDVEGQEVFRSAVARIEGSLENEEEEGRQMRRIVGLDTTLDFEDEEDEFDIAAVGREGDAKRTYMSEVKGSNMKVDNCLPLSFYDLRSAPRDPRANHVAAKVRLEEDAREASTGLMSSEANGEQGCTEAEQVATANVKQIFLPPGCNFVSDDAKNTVANAKRSISESEIQKNNSCLSLVDSSTSSEKVRPVKRVRFALDVEQRNEAPVCQKVGPKPKVPSLYPSRVPDYVRNPSKYTHYTLDWSTEDNEESNFEAFKACADMIRRNHKEESPHPESEEMRQRILFIPRYKKSSEAVQKPQTEEDDQSLSHPVSVEMCTDDSKPKRETRGLLNGALDICESQEDITSESMSEPKAIKGPKHYRSRKGVADSEEEMKI